MCAGMATRERPQGCCPARAVRPLPARDLERLVTIFKALADATRLEILHLVGAQTGAICVCDIVDRFDLSQPTISHHLRVLREAGLLRTSKIGIWAFYELEAEAKDLLDEAAALLAAKPARSSRA